MKTVSLPIKLIYGTGQAAESIKNFGFGTLLLLYYNQVLGLSGTYSGIAVFIAVAFDAITDPAVGSWSARPQASFHVRQCGAAGDHVLLSVLAA